MTHLDPTIEDEEPIDPKEGLAVEGEAYWRTPLPVQALWAGVLLAALLIVGLVIWHAVDGNTRANIERARTPRVILGQGQ